MPLIMVTAVVGIAQVVSADGCLRCGEKSAFDLQQHLKVATAVSVVGITNVMALICSSASGAIAMTLDMFRGLAVRRAGPEWIHRGCHRLRRV